MTNKIIFFDIDGTLLDHQKQLPESACEAVNDLQKKGYFVAIATGRPSFTFEDLRKKLNIHSYVSLNGQYVVHEDEVVFKNPLNYEGLEKLTSLTATKKHPLIYVNEKGWQSTVKDHPHVLDAIDSLKVGILPKFDPEAYKNDEKYQALLFCDQNDELSYKEIFNQFSFVRWHDYSVDVLPKGGSKALGIKKLMDAVNIDEEHAYAFGDGLNDREMLEFIPNSVAMGNAADEVKRFAKYVTKDVAKDGIYHGLKKVGLL